MSSVGESRDMLDNLDWPPLKARREKSSLAFFHKIHMGTLSIDKDTYLTPTLLLQQTRAHSNSQYHRYHAYTNALKKKIFSPGLFHSGIVPGLFHSGIVCPHLW